MKTQYVEKNKGQILVVVTLMLVGLFAMLALVLDGGYLYTQRRAAQLSADAGAPRIRKRMKTATKQNGMKVRIKLSLAQVIIKAISTS
jgi:uncharacterized membrane protein